MHTAEHNLEVVRNLILSANNSTAKDDINLTNAINSLKKRTIAERHSIDVVVDYDNGNITNNGLDQSVIVGAYKLNDNDDGFEPSTNALFTTDMKTGSVNGALKLRHNLNADNGGAYMVVKNYQFGSNDFTISTWFNVNLGYPTCGISTGSGTYLFGNSNPLVSGNGEFAVMLSQDSSDETRTKLRLRLNGADESSVYIQLVKETWNNIILRRTGDELDLYYNGTHVIKQNLSEKCYIGTKDLAFGGYYGYFSQAGNYYHQNVMCYDNTYIYSKAIDDDMVKTIIGLSPDVDINYSGGVVKNNGNNNSVIVGSYILNEPNNSTHFVNSSNAIYTIGKDGDINGAIVTNHANGAYTAIKNYNLGTNDFTISTWFNIPVVDSLSTGNSSFIVGNGYPGEPKKFGLTLRRYTTNARFCFKIYIDGVISTENINQYGEIWFDDFKYETWYNLSIVRDGNKLKLYVDGILYHSHTLEDNYDFGSYQLAFGGHYGWEHYYHNANIYFDDVQLYSVALTEENIAKYILNQNV